MSNIKEQICAEIERLKSKYRHNGLWTSSFQSDLAMAKIESMNEILSFLDTLPDEPVTDCHELEKSADEYQLEAKKHILDGSPIGTAKDAFIAGAEWQKRKMMEGAVEGVVNHGTAVSYVISDEDQLDERLKQFQNDAEVRIIILPKEEEG